MRKTACSKALPGLQQVSEKLLGCALAGGHSSRMGRDKALLRPFGPSGPTMLEHAFGILQNLCGECLVSTAPERPYPPYPCIFDEKPDLGPISGLVGALIQARKKGYAGIFALACDLPLMRTEILKQLTDIPPGKWSGIFFSNPESGQIEMLAGIYALKALSPLQRGIERGIFGLYAALAREDLLLVPYGKNDAPFFFNCNSLEDIACLEKFGS